MIGGLPALCAELKIRADSNVALVNSRDVAEVFGKRHDNVLRDIDAISHTSDLRDEKSSWFREIQSEHSTVSGRFDRSFDLTRDGFTLLVMGWTGERAMAFKVRYIEAFDAMNRCIGDHGDGGSDVSFELFVGDGCRARRSVCGVCEVGLLPWNSPGTGGASLLQ